MNVKILSYQSYFFRIKHALDVRGRKEIHTQCNFVPVNAICIIIITYPNYFCFLRFIFQVVRQGKEVSSLYLITSPSRDALAAATLSLNLFTVPLVRAAYVTLTWFASERTLTQSPVARLDEKQIQFSFEKTCVFRDLRNCIH